jgi:hypothetical protein
MKPKINAPSLAAVLVLVSPLLATAQSVVGRLPCIDAVSALRQGTFRLPVGLVVLRDGKACVKPSADYRGCEWGVELTRAEMWGPEGRYLVAVVEANHDTPGTWTSVFVLTCKGGTHETMFARSFGPRGGKLALGSDSSFDVTTGEWLPSDPGCCPTNERRTTYLWDESRQSFTEVGSRVMPVQTPR